MKAIRTWYIGPGYSRGMRMVATDGDGCRVTLHYRHDLNIEGNHLEAVKALCAKRGWHGELVEGFVMKAGRVDCRVWVWLEFGQGQRLAQRITI